MPDDIAQIRLKILWLQQSLRLARSAAARDYALAMLKEQEAYLAVLQTQSDQADQEPGV